MKISIFLFIAIHILFVSCHNVSSEPQNQYSGVNEINLPTNTQMGLAYDGNYIWYSDTLLHTINQLSANGDILKTIDLGNCHVTDFYFTENYIWCINDHTVYSDTSIHYLSSDTIVSVSDYGCIYQLTLNGEILDSILVQEVHPIEKPQFLGLAVLDTIIYITTNDGYSSGIIRYSINQKKRLGGLYCFLAGLTTHNDSIYAISKNYVPNDRIVVLDSITQISDNMIIDIDFTANDVVFVDDDMWVGDSDHRKLVKMDWK